MYRRSLGRGREEGRATMTVVAKETTQPCPECGAGITADSRFTVWCAVCDWNIDPARPEERKGLLERTRRARARRHGEKLLTEVTAGTELRAGRDASTLLAHAIALAVHALTLLLVA